MKYCPEIVEQLCQSIRDMKGRVGASKEANISFETFSQWMKGNIPEDEFWDCKTDEERAKKKSEFSDAIKAAESEAEDTKDEIAELSIISAMKDDWRAAAWRLERTKRGKYSPPKTAHALEGSISITLLQIFEKARLINQNYEREHTEPNGNSDGLPPPANFLLNGNNRVVPME